MVSLRSGGQSDPGFAFGVSATDSVQRKYSPAERDDARGPLSAAKDVSTVTYHTITNGKQMY